MIITLKLDRHELKLHFPYDLANVKIVLVDTQLTITDVENDDVLFQFTSKGNHGIPKIIGVSNE